MKYIAYMFELKSIQNYLMEGGRLKDMVNASDMLEQLTTDEPDGENFLDTVLQQCGLDLAAASRENPQLQVTRRAGGAVYLIADERFKDSLARFRQLWTLLVQQFIPGCEFVDCLTEGKENVMDCVADGKEKLLSQRSLFYPDLPLSTPFTRVSPRTGRAAVWVDKDKKEPLDKPAKQKRKHRIAAHLTDKFYTGSDYRWPQSLDRGKFPYLGEESDIAIIHIDGNGLGQILMNLSAISREVDSHTSLSIYAIFSEQLKRATEAAAREATEKVLIEDCRQRTGKLGDIFAARPLVLGGDDLTLTIRADLSLKFCVAFVEAFEHHTAGIKKAILKSDRRLKDSRKLSGFLPERLTACGGVVFQKANQPFMMGYELAENLCHHAKEQSRQVAGQGQTIPSSLCFYQIQGAVTENYRQILEQELKTVDNQHLTMGAYGLGQYYCREMPSLRLLLDCVSLLGKKEYHALLSRLRQWAGMLLQDADMAADFRLQIDKFLRLKHRQYYDLSHALQALMSASQMGLDEIQWFDGNGNSPVVDLLTLTSLEVA